MSSVIKTPLGCVHLYSTFYLPLILSSSPLMACRPLLSQPSMFSWLDQSTVTSVTVPLSFMTLVLTSRLSSPSPPTFYSSFSVPSPHPPIAHTLNGGLHVWFHNTSCGHHTISSNLCTDCHLSNELVDNLKRSSLFSKMRMTPTSAVIHARIQKLLILQQDQANPRIDTKKLTNTK
jgi:hypothetical protein